MFLSNPRKSFLLAGFFALFFQACGSPQSNENKPVPLTIETKSEFPFPTKEPEIYQGDFIVGNGQFEDKWFVARKGDKWRLDFFSNGEMRRSEIRADRSYSIDHSRKIFAETPENNYLPSDPLFFDDMTHNFFKGKEYREFEEIGRADGLIKYKVRNDATSKDSVLISIDASSGMIVRQEFTAVNGQLENGLPVSFIYEIRNLKTDVDDSIFAIPEGFKKVTWGEYSPPVKRK
jgi:hypothetical protein